ncbi:hypothetical protein [Serratia fonticola]|uniref:hypothetical protein n=1 Tax=Serratia fonticola TaxID=47917 RepID=UPI00192D1516|nr:hypothetical protein [Serratia fonticola]MBL5827014.1 hypothetical protein [Serratia fonticola]
MSNATCQKEAFPLAGNLSKPDIWPRAMLTIDNTTDHKAGGAILTIPKALSAAGHYPVLDNAVMHSFLHAATFAHRVSRLMPDVVLGSEAYREFMLLDGIMWQRTRRMARIEMDNAKTAINLASLGQAQAKATLRLAKEVAAALRPSLCGVQNTPDSNEW